MVKLKELPNLDGWNVNLLLAIMWQESKLELDAKRFEPHVFERYSNNKKKPKSYEAAKNISEINAFRATSWGVAQVMGFNIISDATKNNLTVRHIISDLRNDPQYQIDLMVGFIRNQPKKFLDMFQYRADIDFAYTAKIYNGSGYKKNNYDVLIEKYYNQYRTNEAALGSFAQKVQLYGKVYSTSVYDPRILKMQEELGVNADGYFGKKTHEALNRYVEKNTVWAQTVLDVGNKHVEKNTAKYQELIGSELQELSKPLTEEQRVDLSKTEERKKLFAETPIKNHDHTKEDDTLVLNTAMSDEPEKTVRDLQEVKSVQSQAASYGGYVEGKEKNLSLIGKLFKWLRF